MIASRLRSEARSGSSNVPSTRYANHHGSFYGNKLQHSSDADLKRALQRSYTSQTVRRWEKRWVTIHETSMKVHKWMPVIVNNRTTKTTMNNEEKKKEEQPDESSSSTQETQILLDEESISQMSQN